jgi:hypothetical protein
MESPTGARVATESDYSRDALARFIDYVVEKGLVHSSTAQGWRVATSKVLQEVTPAEREDVRRVDVEATFREFLRRNPERLSPASVGEYRRRVGRAIEEFVRWVENPGGYGPRAAAWSAKAEARPRSRPPAPERAASPPSARAAKASDIALEYPLRPDLLAQVVVPRDLTVEEARRMGAFLVTLAVDFRPAGNADGAA